MAVQPSSPHTVPLYVLIVFIVLFIASTTGLVILFVHQEDLSQQADRATTEFETHIGSKLARTGRLERFKELGKAQRTSAVAALLAERDQLAQMLTGAEAATAKDAADRLEQMLNVLPAQAAALKQSAQVDVLGALQQAAAVLETMAGDLETVKGQLADCQRRNTIMTKTYKDMESKFEARTSQFIEQLKTVATQFETYKAQYDQTLESIKSTISDDLKAELVKTQKEFNQHIDDLQDMVRRNLRLLIGSMKDIGPAEFRMTAAMTVDKLIQQVDGQVLSLAGDVVYVDLGTEHGLTAGTRFVVCSPTERGSANPEIKAVVEVVETGKMVSEARVVSVKPDAPVLRGDLLISLVFDRELKLRFFVLGDFDLNGDGIADPNGRQRVQQTIVSAGADASSQLSPLVNFTVLGAAPESPTAPSASADAGEQEEYRKKLQTLRTYNDLKDQVRALALPVITPDVFLKFTGSVYSRT